MYQNDFEASWHKYFEQYTSQESSKKFILISMAVDPSLNLLACLLYYNVEKSSY